MARPAVAPDIRFFSRVGGNFTPGACWEWAGWLTHDGYGTFKDKGVKRTAQWWSYQWFNGNVPPGLQIDHVCRNRSCVNPEHLEAVTPQINQRRGMGFSGINGRKTHCPYGHPYDEENTGPSGKGRRRCRTCHRERARLDYRARMAASPMTHRQQGG